MYCNNCGYDIPADSAFCPVCGTTNQTLQTHTYAQSPEIPASSSKKGVFNKWLNENRPNLQIAGEYINNSTSTFALRGRI